jgi:hypothetical protein
MIPGPLSSASDAKAKRYKQQIHPLITSFYTALLCMFLYLFAHTGGKRWLNPC